MPRPAKADDGVTDRLSRLSGKQDSPLRSPWTVMLLPRSATLLLVAALMTLARPLAAQLPTGRWEILIRGPASTGESGEIRFEKGRARLLLQSSDSAFRTVSGLAMFADSITFSLPALDLTFGGIVSPTAINGVLRGGGANLVWQAWPLPDSLDKWPVRPRVVVHQLLLGREQTRIVIPGAWVAAMPSRASLEAEFVKRLAAAGLGSPESSSPVPEMMALGFDPTTRAALYQLLEQVARSPAGGKEFEAHFGIASRRRLDIHDRAMEAARQQLTTFRLDNVPAGLAALGVPLPLNIDSMEIVAATWRLWNRMARDPVGLRVSLNALREENAPAARALEALLSGYDIASEWWSGALTWLLRAKWLETTTGWRSPMQLVAGFWGRDSLALPLLIPTRFGGHEASAQAAIGPIAARLVTPGNAIAAEWLARHGTTGVFTAWRKVEAKTDSLELVLGNATRRLTSPMGWARAHQTVFLPERDQVMIDPGIVPLFAVATVVHEWQHLLAAAERSRQQALRRPPANGVRMLDEVPWLAEGGAEWATDLILARGGKATGLLRLLEAGKRAVLERQGGDDPHATGYRLVMAVAVRGVPTAVLRRRLVNTMHDPAAFARASGLTGNRGARPLVLDAPDDAVVIPEISFTWDSDFADGVRRRLIVPPFRPEH